MKDQFETMITQMIERGLLYEEALAEFERRFILKGMELNGGNQSKTAAALGLHRNTLARKLASFAPPSKSRKQSARAARARA